MTLTVDEELLQAVRRIAEEQHTSIDDMVRDYLTTVASNHFRLKDQAYWKELADEFAELARTSPAVAGPITWTRDELHDRDKW